MPTLPQFIPSSGEKQWIKKELHTAQFIQLLWNRTSKRDHNDSEFLKMLIQCAWVNNSKGKGDAGRRWRNQRIAGWLHVDGDISENQLAGALVKKLGISTRRARQLLREKTGITHYFHPFRTTFLKKVEKHSTVISKAFTLVSSKHHDVEHKNATVAKLVFNLPDFQIPKKRGKKRGSTSMMNGLAPALACMDSKRRFPIVNGPTKRLLSASGKKADVDGILSLFRLIGQKGIRDSFYLDVYATSKRNKFKPAKSRKSPHVQEPREIGLKSEENVYASYVKRRSKIRRCHNILLNKFKQAVEWKYKKPEESEYDVLIRDWRKPGRLLLIEAKTETKGASGRAQVRQAIGQLFDYRWRSFKKIMKKVDMALLVPKKPDQDILNLLDSLEINVIWFDGSELKGTMNLT